MENEDTSRLEDAQEFAKTIGKPLHFDIDHYLDSVEQVICCDELEHALWMLDHLPGWYRENYPARATQIKRMLHQALLTVKDYATDTDEEDKRDVPRHERIDTIHCYPRGFVSIGLVKQINEKGLIPHIVEFGPADFWLPYGLQAKGLSFTYKGITINQSANHLSDIFDSTPKENAPHIFVCFETIEHLWHPEDIRHFYDKALVTEFDHILLSTPLNTLYGGLPNWSTRPLGHLRTFTRDEFLNFARRMFPGFSWTQYVAPMQVLWGKRDDTGDAGMA